MANEIETTPEAAVFIPELWRPGFLKAMYADSVARPRVLNADGDVKYKGDILHIRISPTCSVNNVGSTGTLTNQALTATEAQLSINTWKEVTFEIIDNAAAQADEFLEAALKEGVPRALAEQVDKDILALYDELTSHTAIDATAGITDDLLLDAFVALLQSNVPMNNPNDVTWFFSPTLIKPLKQITGISEAHITGEAKGGLVISKVPDILGVPVMFTTSVTHTGGECKNMLIHREALACGVQKNINIEQLARTKKSTVYSADMMYGVKSVRATHGIVIATA